MLGSSLTRDSGKESGIFVYWVGVGNNYQNFEGGCSVHFGNLDSHENLDGRSTVVIW